MAKGKEFEGTSKRGNLEEALQEAIKAAQAGLHSDHVSWTLLKISGQHGGFVGANDLTVTIEA